MNYIKGILFIGLLLLFSAGAMADKLEIKVGQVKMKVPFWPAKQAHYGAVVLVRGGEDLRWSELLAHFARQLANNGWSVVLLNCKNTGSVPWIQQVPEVISTLRQNKNKRIVMLHYGDQLNQSLEYFSKPQAKTVNGLVLISAYDDQSVAIRPTALRFPLFDVAGQFDYDHVLTQMQQRIAIFKEQAYLALEMPGAHHEYEYSQKLLLAFIHGWMSKLPEYEPQLPPIMVSFIEPYSLLTV